MSWSLRNNSLPFWLTCWACLTWLQSSQNLAAATPAWLAKEAAVESKHGLYRFEGCKLIPTEWADGDSFSVETPSGRQFTIRLYGVDCFETTPRDATDARRLRSQRRWFGIVKATPQESMQLAIQMGDEGGVRVRELLKEPFTVITAFVDGRGDPEFERFYGFVEDARGNDLGSRLVSEGLARAFGVVRSTWEGLTREEYYERLKDLELISARQGKGAWAHTVWEQLPEERRLERNEELELSITAPLLDRSVNPNTATRDQLDLLPGVGEALANRIVEAREEAPFQNLQDLQRVPGIGAKMTEAIEPFLIFE